MICCSTKLSISLMRVYIYSLYIFSVHIYSVICVLYLCIVFYWYLCRQIRMPMPGRFVLFMLLTQHAATAHRILVWLLPATCHSVACVCLCVAHAAFPQNERPKYTLGQRQKRRRRQSHNKQFACFGFSFGFGYSR